MSSIPHDSRMKPSATGSIPQRPRRSAVECAPPNEVASATSVQRRQEPLRGRGVGQRERHDRSEQPAHLPRRRRRGRGATAGRDRARRRRARTSAAATASAFARLALDPHAERRQRAVREPRLERPGDRARHVAPRPHRGGVLGRRGSRRARGSGRSGPVIAFEFETIETSAPIVSAGWASGVASEPSTTSSAPRACTASASAAMSITVSGRVRRRLDPDEPRAGGRLHQRVEACSARRGRRCPAAWPPSARRRRSRRAARPARRSTRAPPWHAAIPEAKPTHGAALERLERRLPVRPRRVRVARVAGRRGVAGQVVRPREHRPGQERLPVGGGRQAGVDRARARPLALAHSSRTPLSRWDLSQNGLVERPPAAAERDRPRGVDLPRPPVGVDDPHRAASPCTGRCRAP